MGILGRINTVVRSNLNELIDKMSDPGKEIDLLVSDMDEAERQGRKELVSSLAGVKLAQKRVGELEAEVERWQGRAEQAVRHGDDALAREALAQKRVQQQLAEEARGSMQEQQGYTAQLEDSMREFTTRLTAIKARQATLREEARAAKRGGPESLTSPAMQAFDRIQHRIDTMEAEASLGHTLDGKAAATEAKFRALEGPDPEVEDALAALKRKMEE
jgi:phage shock protein A